MITIRSRIITIMILSCFLQAFPNDMFISLGVSLPQEDFSNHSNFDRDGFAKTGVSGQFGYAVSLPPENFNWTTQAGVTWHPMDLEELQEELPFSLVNDISGGHYWKFNLWTGPFFEYKLEPTFGLFVGIQGGIAHWIQGDLTGESETLEGKIEFDAHTQPVGTLTGGLNFGKIATGIRWMFYDDLNLDYELTGNWPGEYNEERDIDVGMLQVFVNLKL